MVAGAESLSPKLIRQVLVHCSSGKDRTGPALAYALVRARGLDVYEAMAAVREARPIAFSAGGWYDFAATVLSVREPASG